jgi:5'-3' exonuclease
MEKLLLIDGNNMAMRSAYSFMNLSVPLMDFTKEFNPDNAMDKSNNFPTGVLHGFFKSLASMRNRYPDYYIAIVWDGGYHRRTDLTKVACDKGLIPETYKENRRKKAPDEVTLNFIKQKQPLKEAISLTNFPQIVVDGEEADDVVASYANKYMNQARIIALSTNDKDYYQLIGDKVFVLRNEEIMDIDSFSREYGIHPSQWVDVSAFEGDAGDNIFGVPGWGSKTSLDTIRDHGSFESAMTKFHTEYDHLRVTYPDLTEEGLKPLLELKNSNKKPKYPNIDETTPFTGVALAVEAKKIKKMPKVILTALMYEERASLAKILKKMKTDIDLPELPMWNRNMEEQFVKFCEKYGLSEVASLSGKICAAQPQDSYDFCLEPRSAAPLDI